MSAAGTTFGDLVLNASTVTIDGAMDVNGDLTISSLYRLNDGQLNVSGDVKTLDTSFSGSGTVVLDGVADQTISADGGHGELHNVSINKPSGNVTIADQIDISGSYTDNGASVDATSATVELQGNPSLSASGTTFGDLVLNASTVTVDGAMDVNGDLTISSLYRLNDGQLNVSGDVKTLDTSFSGSGTVVLDGVADQTISADGGHGELHNVSINKPSGNVTIADQIDISGSYADNGTNVDATGATVRLQGNPSVSASSTTFGDMVLNASTVTLDGDVWVSGDLSIEQLYRLEGGTIHVAGEISDLDGSWSGGGNVVSWVPNEAPSDIALSGSTIAENAAPGTIVGTASASDPDAGETFTYELFDAADGRFAIDPQTGQIRVAEGAQLDFEDTETHQITVKVTDSAGHEREEAFVIGISPVNEAVSNLTIEGGSVAENAAPGTIVGTASASDPDAGETFTYELSDAADGRFAIDPQTGQIRVAEGAQLDFKDAETHQITVKVTDSAGNEREETFVIGVEFAGADSTTVAEDVEQDPEGHPVAEVAGTSRAVGDGLFDDQPTATEAKDEVRTIEEIEDSVADSEQMIREGLQAGRITPADVVPVDDGENSGLTYLEEPSRTDWEVVDFGQVVQDGDATTAKSRDELDPNVVRPSEGDSSVNEPAQSGGVLATFWGLVRALGGSRGASSHSGAAERDNRRR